MQHCRGLNGILLPPPVPAVFLDASKTAVPWLTDLGRGRGKVKEDSWLQRVTELLNSDNEDLIN